MKIKVNEAGYVLQTLNGLVNDGGAKFGYAVRKNTQKVQAIEKRTEKIRLEAVATLTKKYNPKEDKSFNPEKVQIAIRDEHYKKREVLLKKFATYKEVTLKNGKKTEEVAYHMANGKYQVPKDKVEDFNAAEGKMSKAITAKYKKSNSNEMELLEEFELIMNDRLSSEVDIDFHLVQEEDMPSTATAAYRSQHAFMIASEQEEV